MLKANFLMCSPLLQSDFEGELVVLCQCFRRGYRYLVIFKNPTHGKTVYQSALFIS